MLSLGEVGFQENGGNNSFLSSGIGESEDSSYCIGITVPYKITSYWKWVLTHLHVAITASPLTQSEREYSQI
jgi:hypothetical protein